VSRGKDRITATQQQVTSLAEVCQPRFFDGQSMERKLTLHN